MTRNQRIRELLEEGPCSSRDVADELEITPRSACVGLWVLQRHRHVKPVATVRVEGVKRSMYLYDLTPSGRGVCRRSRLSQDGQTALAS